MLSESCEGANRTKAYAQSVRLFRKQEKRILDRQVRKIVKDPAVGREKRGELRGIFVHKFKIHATQYLLSYRMANADTLELIMIGPYEKYY